MTRATLLSRLVAPMRCLCAALVLAGCKDVLHSDPSETEANEMVAVLAAGGISAGRERDKAGTYALKVDGALVADAVVILRRAGYPGSASSPSSMSLAKAVRSAPRLTSGSATWSR